MISATLMMNVWCCLQSPPVMLVKPSPTLIKEYSGVECVQNQLSQYSTNVQKRSTQYSTDVKNRLLQYSMYRCTEPVISHLSSLLTAVQWAAVTTCLPDTREPPHTCEERPGPARIATCQVYRTGYYSTLQVYRSDYYSKYRCTDVKQEIMELMGIYHEPV